MDDTRAVGAWGYAGAAPSDAEVDQLAGLLAARFRGADLTRRPPVDWRDVAVAPARLRPPPALSPVCSDTAEDRLRHARGRSYSDVVAAAAGDYGRPPDVVAMPRDAEQVAAVLDWAADQRAAVIPFGGGTSVVGGVTAPAEAERVVTLQLRAMGRVLDVDRSSLAAHIQAGATGPAIADQLRPEGLTLRFFPQSYEMSTLGGWLATRAAGHFATGPTHIDDLVEAMTAETPAGTWSSRRLPASGAGPSPDRLLLGSEGILGVVTDAWVRVQPLARHKAGATVAFTSFSAGAAAVRAVAQSGLQPANCRLLDPTEALLAGAGGGDAALLLLGFESTAAPVHGSLQVALALARDAGGTVAARQDRDDGDPAERWKGTFLRAPYLRDALVSLGVLSETFETAVTWDRFDALVDGVLEVTTRAVHEVCGDGVVTCRVTHAYPDGAAPYFTVIAPAARGSEVEQWAQVKAAASEALLAHGGTITHHHAVGRDHRRWYDRQRPAPFAAALAAAKAALDPAGLLNPGVLLGGS